MLTQEMVDEYNRLYATIVVDQKWQSLVSGYATLITWNQSRYIPIAQQFGAMPWYFVGLIHLEEASCKFTRHLHNGDPLTARTVHVPVGRIPNINPPYTFEQSAYDALTMIGFQGKADWSIAAILYRLESYNGFGYRQYNINTPYLWSFTSHYTSGKFTSDGHFDPNVVSGQCGLAPILKMLAG